MTVAPASPDIAEASVREFRKGHIQDHSLDRDHQEAWLRKHPVTDEASLRPLEDRIASLHRGGDAMDRKWVFIVSEDRELAAAREVAGPARGDGILGDGGRSGEA